MANDSSYDALNYAWRLFENVIDWYKNADTKAQVILTLDGAFIGFLTSSIFLKKIDLKAIFHHFGVETFLFLSLMVVALTSSIVSALSCLKSRLALGPRVKGLLEKSHQSEDKERSYPPELMWYFYAISLLNWERFRSQIHRIDNEYETDAIASQIHIISGNVTEKHIWVNRGFLFLVFSLVMFLCMGTSYVVRLIT